MSSVSGAATLLRFHLRRDRVMLLCWIAGNVVLYYSQAVSTDGLYTTQAELDKAAAGMESNAAFIAMAGPARALDTVGGQVAWQASAFGAIVAALMSMFVIGRHTRAEEETGRDELVRASSIGRHAPLAAAGLAVLVANLLLGLLIAASLISYGLPTAGSVALGFAAALAGLVFGAVAMVAVQIADGTRLAYGITGAAIGLAYLLRAVGDVGNGVLSWLSPIGWGQAMRAYAGEVWWPALLSVATMAVLVPAAVLLFDRRDIGSGLLASRPGPARGALSSTLGLVWRLQRGAVFGWMAGLFLMGLAFGSIGDDVTDLVGDSQFSRDLFARGGGSVVDAFYATLAVMLGLVAAGFAIASVLRLRGEEDDHYAELLLSTAEPRWRWATAHLVVTAGGAVAVVAAGGLGLGLGYGLVTGDSSTGVRLWAATMQYVVPVLLLGALVWCVYGFRPRWTVVGWVLLAFSSVVMLFGDSMQIPQGVRDVSPFEQLALLPAQEFQTTPVVLLSAVVLALAAGGWVALRRRDVG